MADDKVRASQGNDPMTNHDSKFLGRKEMKRKVLSVLLASAMVASLAACGSSNDAPAASTDSAATGSAAASTEAASTEAYNLEEINVVVNGTLTATVDNGQAEFVQQWDDAVSEAIGHPIKKNNQQ